MGCCCHVFLPNLHRGPHRLCRREASRRNGHPPLRPQESVELQASTLSSLSSVLLGLPFALVSHCSPHSPDWTHAELMANHGMPSSPKPRFAPTSDLQAFLKGEVYQNNRHIERHLLRRVLVSFRSWTSKWPSRHPKVALSRRAKRLSLY